jgi:hypothetical protein
MKNTLLLLIILFIILSACGRRSEEETEVIEAEPQALPTFTPLPATPIPTPVPQTEPPLKTEIEQPQPESDSSSASPVPTPPVANRTVSPLGPPVSAQGPNDRIDPLPGTETLVAQAKGMLAEMLGPQVIADQIALVAMEAQEWGDSSLGCPQPGQAYAQVITPGYEIILEMDGRPYTYHTDMGNTVVPCFEEGQAQPGAGVVQLPGPAARPMPADAVINYRRSGGFAGVSDEWTVFVDGQVKSAAGQAWQVSAQEISDLVQAAEEAGFFSMQSSYIPKNACCDRFMYHLTIRLGNQVHTVETIDAAPGMPAELGPLLREVDDALRAQVQ